PGGLRSGPRRELPAPGRPRTCLAARRGVLPRRAGRDRRAPAGAAPGPVRRLEGHHGGAPGGRLGGPPHGGPARRRPGSPVRRARRLPRGPPRTGDGVTFEVWAPLPERVELELAGEIHPMERDGSGWW